MVKKKRLTQREKALNARVKKELQAEGILPPDKPRLNRKKFAEETLAEFEQMDLYSAGHYLNRAVNWMVSANAPKITAEQVGILKLIKIAVETQKYMKALEAEGETQYQLGDYYEKVIRPVKEL